jgi:hypothetical protein
MNSVAFVEGHFSREIAPTRRVAIGAVRLPASPTPGPTTVLLGGILATFLPRLSDEDAEALPDLLDAIATGRRLSQPRMRHRFQTDRVGLWPSRHELVEVDGQFRYHIGTERGTPAQQVLLVCYAAMHLPRTSRLAAVEALEKAGSWRGRVDDQLIAFLLDRSDGSGIRAASDPVLWATTVLRLASEGQAIDDDDVRRAFRDGVRAAHPDRGGSSDSAAKRIADLTEARRILLRR